MGTYFVCFARYIMQTHSFYSNRSDSIFLFFLFEIYLSHSSVFVEFSINVPRRITFGRFWPFKKFVLAIYHVINWLFRSICIMIWKYIGNIWIWKYFASILYWDSFSQFRFISNQTEYALITFIISALRFLSMMRSIWFSSGMLNTFL